ncbi:winged helix-turn-helix transcriptional regulator [Streptomyces galbus]|uniref:Helix-turn-helix transcriptional regulator n=1 Tax=Streptomyces galbus TaxID=33898 RepID=A0A4U5X4T8_STRGB|nr:helix-turn-helix domain-containing protein [Streptomyces galbus]TKT09860.1 helix-turn-helix transcriptional regulator [Streptomyces galbus]GHD32307.1 transcriptional regulator [Streptomyces galbus]
MTTHRTDPYEVPGRPCSIAAALQVVGDRWSLLAVREVTFGNHRFRQIARNTGAPTDRLSARLKSLVADGVLERRPLPDDPRHDGYYLTEAGRDLLGVIRELLRWGDRWLTTSPPMRLRHHDHDLSVRPVCAHCGEPVTRGEVHAEVAAAGWTLAGPALEPAGQEARDA